MGLISRMRFDSGMPSLPIFEAHIAVLADEAGGRRREARREADGFDGSREGGLDFFEQRAEIFLLRVEFFALGFFLFVAAQFDFAAADEDDFFAVEFGDLAEENFVVGVGQTEHFAAFLFEGFQMGAVFDDVERFAGNGIDVFLVGRHARNVLGKRRFGVCLVFGFFVFGDGKRRNELHEFEQTIFVFVIGSGAFFDVARVLIPEFCVFVGIIFACIFEQIEDFFDDMFADRRNAAVFLENFAGNVEV